MEAMPQPTSAAMTQQMVFDVAKGKFVPVGQGNGPLVMEEVVKNGHF